MSKRQTRRGRTQVVCQKGKLVEEEPRRGRTQSGMRRTCVVCQNPTVVCQNPWYAKKANS